MRARAIIAALLLLAAPALAPAQTPEERVVAGLSQNRVAITANFDGSEIIVYGAIRREAPAPAAPPGIIVTVEGPAGPVTVRRKERVLGIWVNAASVQIDSAPSFYAVASTAPLPDILTGEEDTRHRITVPQMIAAPPQARPGGPDAAFTEGLIRLRGRAGGYQADADVAMVEDVLFRTDVMLPANLTEGLFRVRIFLTRDGRVIDRHETEIEVRKEGVERFLHHMAMEQPLIYGLLSLALAALAGWGASALFARLRF